VQDKKLFCKRIGLEFGMEIIETRGCDTTASSIACMELCTFETPSKALLSYFE
jgi:hypothetical protein